MRTRTIGLCEDGEDVGGSVLEGVGFVGDGEDGEDHVLGKWWEVEDFYEDGEDGAEFVWDGGRWGEVVKSTYVLCVGVDDVVVFVVVCDFYWFGIVVYDDVWVNEFVVLSGFECQFFVFLIVGMKL